MHRCSGGRTTINLYTIALQMSRLADRVQHNVLQEVDRDAVQ